MLVKKNKISILTLFIFYMVIGCTNKINEAFGSKEKLQKLSNDAFFNTVERWQIQNKIKPKSKSFISPLMLYRSNLCFDNAGSCFDDTMKYKDLPINIIRDTLMVVIPKNLEGSIYYIQQGTEMVKDVNGYGFISPLIKSKLKNEYLMVYYLIADYYYDEMRVRMMDKKLLRFEQKGKKLKYVETITFDEFYTF
jgi:hypothetical protein